MRSLTPHLCHVTFACVSVLQGKDTHVTKWGHMVAGSVLLAATNLVGTSWPMRAILACFMAGGGPPPFRTHFCQPCCRSPVHFIVWPECSIHSALDATWSTKETTAGTGSMMPRTPNLTWFHLCEIQKFASYRVCCTGTLSEYCTMRGRTVSHLLQLLTGGPTELKSVTCWHPFTL